MSSPEVVVAEALAEAALVKLREQFDVKDLVGEPRDKLLAALATADGLIVRSATDVDSEMITAAPNLKVIGRAGIGVDNIDVPAATEAGVMVINAPNANTISAAEHTMALLLAQARRVPEADASLRAGAWERKRLQGVELHGKTLGILGLGRIGALVAQRAASFGMQIFAYDPFVSEERAQRLGVKLMGLDDVLVHSDFITIHLPRTKETEGLLDATTLAGMKPGVRIVNVARGGIVDEQALADAIVAGHVAGAAIDVFAVEPTTESPLFDLPQVVVTPHLGASTLEAQDKAGLSVAEDLVAALSGQFVSSSINVEMGSGVPDELAPHVELAEHLGSIFTLFSFGLPDELTVTAQGPDIADHIQPLSLGALKGAMQAASDEPVSYVNAPVLAAHRGLVVHRKAQSEATDYANLLRLSGDVGLKRRSIAGTVMGRRGPVLTEVDGYGIEFPITDHMVLLRNDDIPGMIGRVGSFLGENGVNISDMAVGRKTADGDAMMGLSIDNALSDDVVAALRELDGIKAVRYLSMR